jgi:hypothetical protein
VIVPLRCFCRLVAILLTLGFITPSRSRAATPQEVQDSIKKAKEFLYSQQNKEGNWEELDKPQDSQYGGLTAIATYALLAGGETFQDPKLRKPLEFLETLDMKGVYALGLRAQVWTFLPDDNKAKKILLARDAEILFKGAAPLARWGYTAGARGEHNSPSQYGVLGMWAAAVNGVEIPKSFWEICERGWMECQAADGGWSYHVTPPTKDNPVKATMTAAGVASLFITQDLLRAEEGVGCRGNITNPRLEAGLKWMSVNFAPTNDGYLLYGIERIGVASGYKYFGKHDWYQVGAETLVRGQKPDGSWESHGKVPGTSFGILFLVRGSAPVMMNKLQYTLEPVKRNTTTAAPKASAAAKQTAPKTPSKPPKEGHWNQRSRDAANIAKWVGRNVERDLNWQIVNLDVPVEELHDAPILYIAGDQSVSFSDEDKAKLREFVEGGGLILANADCGKSQFANAIRKLGPELFPKYDFRTLPQDHPIFTNQQFPISKWDMKPTVLSLGNGAREFIILIPQNDPGRAWQAMELKKEELFQLAANIFLYAVDKQNLRTKGETYIVKKDDTIKSDRTLKVARLEYDGNWNPEPGGWRRLARWMHNNRKVEMTVETVKLGDGKLLAGKFKVAHLTGVGAFKLTDAARGELKDFILGGGTLVIDSAGGGGEFTQSAELEIEATLGDNKQFQDVLPSSHAIYNLPTSSIKDVEYRSWAKRTLGNVREPNLRAIQMDDRAAVILSREDLSVGLVGMPLDGIHGYSPTSATLLMSNMLLYAMGESRQPATAQASSPSSAPATEPAAGR